MDDLILAVAGGTVRKLADLDAVTIYAGGEIELCDALARTLEQLHLKLAHDPAPHAKDTPG